MLTLIFFCQVEAKAYLEKEFANKRLTVGDPFYVVVEITTSDKKDISEPFIDSIEPFAIIDKKSRTIQERGNKTCNYRFQIVAFNTGDLKLPGFKFLIKDQTKIDTIQTNPVDIRITSILPEGMKDINDIKEIIDFPNFLPVILLVIAIAVAIIGFLGYRLYKKMEKKKISEEEKIPCWERALNALDKLSKEDFLKRGMVKKFYYNLSEILKRYLEERFEFPAIEQTTTEIIQTMKLQKIPLRDEFQDVFACADMVKYAKFVPPIEQTENIIRQSRELITKTIPQSEFSEK
uniref:Protein BatD n=1 Tax=candidate division WOR-3 bacterium TaxID=2052148 RepID=A0A7C4XGQ7_UNCW3